MSISPHAKITLDHNRAVKILIGTSKVRAQTFVFKDDKLAPGSSGICEFWFEDKTLIRVGDRFVVRLPTPDVLVGGGIVIDTDLSRVPRSDKGEKKRLELRDVNNTSTLVEQEIRHRGLVSRDVLLLSCNRPRKEIIETASKLVAEGKLIEFHAGLSHAEVVAKHSAKLVAEIEKFHSKHSARRGIPKAEIPSRLGIDEEFADALLAHLKSANKISTDGAFVTLAGFKSQLKPEQTRFRDEILREFRMDRQNPPSRQQLERKAFGVAEVVKFMLDSGELTDLPGGFLLLTEDFEKVKVSVRKHLAAHEKLAVGDIREMFGYSRKYAVPILEKLDQLKITKRAGDYRILFK